MAVMMVACSDLKEGLETDPDIPVDTGETDADADADADTDADSDADTDLHSGDTSSDTAG